MIITIDTKIWEQMGKEIRKADPEYKCVTKYWDLYVRLFQASAYGLEHNGRVVSWAAVKFNKTAKELWGKYINSYLVYTLPEERHKDHATQLHKHIESIAIEAGYSRTKSLIKTYAGFRFHLSLGHTFWGCNTRGELRCDSPLVKGICSPRGLPPEAKDAINSHPLTIPELVEVMQSPLYHQSRTELKSLFKTHRLGYDPSSFQEAPRLC